mgnify:CR=1 FL=1
MKLNSISFIFEEKKQLHVPLYDWVNNEEVETQAELYKREKTKQEQMKKFEKQVWMSGFEKTGKEEVNLYVFRHYMEYYLRHNPRVNTELILMVRQLQPTPQGLPIEL